MIRKIPRKPAKSVLVILFGAGTLAIAYATGSFMTSFEKSYPAAVGQRIDTCSLCHTSTSGNAPRNVYGAAFASNGHSFIAIETLDSDGDGFTNVQEINALTFPGNATDYPAPPPADTTPPAVTAFTVPATATSLSVSITAFAANDNVAVTGYLITESATQPLATAAGWTTTPPATYTFASAGPKTLYAWAKDAAGNVSAGIVSASTSITLPDTIGPTVTAFSVPATATSLSVSITAFTANDNVAVTGYLITESATQPLATAAGWTTTPPATYTFASAGPKTLYAWAKDAAGNVSASIMSAATDVSVSTSDATPPVVTTFSLPATANSLTVIIASFTATDNVGIAGYLVTENAAKPSASVPGWSASAPGSHTFSTAGAKTLYGWAKDAAGNVSSGAPGTTTISLPDSGDPLAGMRIWEGTWFRATIRDATRSRYIRYSYLKILSWDAAAKTLQAVLYTQNRSTRDWESSDLVLHFTSGTALKFRLWFDYADLFLLSGRMSGGESGGVLKEAQFSVAGLYPADNGKNDKDDDNDDSDDRNETIFTIKGKLIALSEVPLEIIMK
jgi:hypothetical protein